MNDWKSGMGMGAPSHDHEGRLLTTQLRAGRV